MEDLKLLLRLYVAPRAAMSSIVDEGSLILGAVGVLLVSVLMAMPMDMAFVKAVVDTSQAAAQPKAPAAPSRAWPCCTCPP